MVLVLCTWKVQDSGVNNKKTQAQAEKFFLACLMIVAPDIMLAITLNDFLKAQDQGVIDPKSYADEIRDRSKTDTLFTLLRVITCLQAFRLVTECIVRAIRHLPITTFEFSTVGYVIV
ncbi:hypothetical protein OBBRIDRAFT_839524 [Obba rivulosa]|uniref:Uncharacterized protein n=1 Tax=Obba rivulosa TaxID=1052685 RepID=A0A8E2AMI2_9APHY|nr:hypothetical protein OBBRIDRAFT_839524 [Obba rivulosa]